MNLKFEGNQVTYFFKLNQQYFLRCINIQCNIFKSILARKNCEQFCIV